MGPNSGQAPSPRSFKRSIIPVGGRSIHGIGQIYPYRRECSLGNPDHCNAAAWVRTGDDNIHAVQPRYGGNQRQPKANTRRAAALFHAVETLQHRFALVARDARTSVADLHADSCVKPQRCGP